VAKPAEPDRNTSGRPGELRAPLSRFVRSRGLFGLLLCCAGGVALAGTGLGFSGYAPPTTASVDSTRIESAVPASKSRVVAGAVIPGFLSLWGLPPIRGQITITDTGLVFESAKGEATASASTISLAYVDRDAGGVHYLFRMEAGVFESDAPGALLGIAADPNWLRSHRPAGWGAQKALVEVSDWQAPVNVAQRIGTSLYADSLFAVFGQPRAPIGIIGRRGRTAGRLGEYIAARDSLAFDPGRMIGEAQLRHAFAHELGHRWQARAKRQLAMLWSGVPAIRDPKRYGYGERSEHQAEAIAFAINFLQTTAGAPETEPSSLRLLDHYELLVPGTRTMVRYLLLQPIYRKHPLRSVLTTASITHAREK
jgi:hypothetical protein